MNSFKKWHLFFNQFWRNKTETQEDLSFDYWEEEDNLGVDNQPYFEYQLKLM